MPPIKAAGICILWLGILLSSQGIMLGQEAADTKKWDPVPKLRLGAEYMYGYRELLGGTNGAFHRIQFAAKYTFGYHNSVADEKN